MAKTELVIGNKNYSSWSLRAWLILKQTGIDFDEIRVSLHTPGYRDVIRKHNPAGKVPVLKEGDHAVWDTLAIGEYLAEGHPSLWPSEAGARALARSVTAEMHSGFPSLRQALPLNCRARGRRVPLSADVSEEIDRIQEIWGDCRSRYGKGGPWLFGSFSIADAFFAPVACRFVTYGIDCKETARDYIETVLSLPSLQEWIRAAGSENETIDLYEVGR